jgi:hypothetical protein
MSSWRKSRKSRIFAQALAKRDRLRFPIWPYDVRCQLGAARRWFAVAAASLGHPALLLTWATAVMGSRLALGMHWPQDLIVATLISWLLVTLATWLAQRFCGPLSPPGEEAQDIKKGGSAGIMLILPHQAAYPVLVSCISISPLRRK